MNFNKIIGYILLAIGLLIIGLTLYYSYNIFTDRVSAPLIFKNQFSQQKSPGLTQQQLQINDAIEKQLSELLPINAIPKLLNLLSWSVLAGIFIFGGGQIANLGIKMVKQ